MIHRNGVFEDLRQFRSLLKVQGVPYQPLLKPSVWRPLRDIAVDWMAIAGAVTLVMSLGWWISPLAVVIVANRQRALGNILHDAAHQNLHRRRHINDSIAKLVVAPLLFADLTSYRRDHLMHHLHLGNCGRDPDHIGVPNRPVGWLENYVRNVLSLRTWWGSLVGGLTARAVSLPSKAYITVWWSALLWILVQFAGWPVVAIFLGVWWVARGTIFHAGTVFREMCDHFGLRPGGVLSFTRDILRRGFWYELVHPRNNGYHLTHHLLPAIPYYRLPQAQRLFAQVSVYRDQGHTYSAYFFGPDAVVLGWRTGERACADAA